MTMAVNMSNRTRIASYASSLKENHKLLTYRTLSNVSLVGHLQRLWIINSTIVQQRSGNHWTRIRATGDKEQQIYGLGRKRQQVRLLVPS
jgi:hypothetical protein